MITDQFSEHTAVNPHSHPHTCACVNFFYVKHTLKTFSLIQQLQSFPYQEAKVISLLFKYICMHIPEKNHLRLLPSSRNLYFILQQRLKLEHNTTYQQKKTVIHHPDLRIC